ncbi:MAG: hypothetical protein AB7U20_03105 [Planctomycetaceae bacterium]
MQFDTQTIDRIVDGVLKQLSTDGEGARVAFTVETPRRGDDAENCFSREASPSATGNPSIVLEANVVTAHALLSIAGNTTQVVVRKQAIVTPAAWDTAKERNIAIRRDTDCIAAHFPCAAGREGIASGSPNTLLLIVVQHTDAVERLWGDMHINGRREVLACPDDAAALAISAICRGEAETVVVFAEQTHRTACHANRNEQVKAVAVRDAEEVKAVRTQLRANVWCIDPTNRNWFELRQLHRAIAGRA